MKRALLVGIALFIFVAGSSALAFQVKVESLKGDVTVRARGGDDFTTAKVGRVIGQGDTVKTGADSSVSLVSDAGDTFFLTNFSIMTVGEASLQKTSLSLGNGKLYCMVRRLAVRETFAVKTPTALAAIRGTTFQAEVAPGKESFKCVDGEIEVTVGGSTMTLQSGEMIEVTPEGAEWEMKIPPGDVLEIKKDGQKLKSLTGDNKLTKSYMKMVRRLAAFKPGKKLGEKMSPLKPKMSKGLSVAMKGEGKAGKVARAERGPRGAAMKGADEEEKTGGAKGPKQKKKGDEGIDVMVSASISVSFVGAAVEYAGEKVAQELEKGGQGKSAGVEGEKGKGEPAKEPEKAEAAEEKEIAEEIEKEEAAEEKAAEEEKTAGEKEAAEEEKATEEETAKEEKAAEEEKTVVAEEPVVEETVQVEPEPEVIEEVELEREEVAQVEPDVVEEEVETGIFEEGMDTTVNLDLLDRSDVIGIDILVETSEAGNRGF